MRAVDRKQRIYLEWPYVLSNSKEKPTVCAVYTIYGKTFKGENIRGFRDYAANCECFPLEYFV